MKIFLDDIREINEKYKYNCVYTYFQCVVLIDAFKNNIEVISLDYDLGADSKQTGFDVLVYMHDKGIQPIHINFHSDHEIGVPKMSSYAAMHFPNTIITTNKI
jgi:hypothetical protein